MRRPDGKPSLLTVTFGFEQRDFDVLHLQITAHLVPLIQRVVHVPLDRVQVMASTYQQGRIHWGDRGDASPPTSPNYIHYTVLKLHIHTQILTQCRVKVVKLGSLTQYICKQV